MLNPEELHKLQRGQKVLVEVINDGTYTLTGQVTFPFTVEAAVHRILSESLIGGIVLINLSQLGQEFGHEDNSPTDDLAFFFTGIQTECHILEVL